MSLVRTWYPSPNYSASRARNQLVVVHTSEGSTDQLSLAAYLANPASQVSYHVCYDNKGDPNTIVECVRRNNKSWSAMQANDWGVHGCCCTPNGASANWSRDTWLSNSTMLRKCAAWISEECAYYGIPLIKVNASDIQAGKKGICGHGDCSAAGAGGSHFDPGNNFPWDVVISGMILPPPIIEDDMPKSFLMQAPNQPVYLVACDLQSKLAIPNPDRLNDVIWCSKQQNPPLLVSETVTPTTADFLAMIPDA